MTDEVFWRSTLSEVVAVLERDHARRREANLRAGLIAATICNVNRKKGTRAFVPEDFVVGAKGGPRPEDYMSPAEGRRALNAWAKGINKHKPKQPQEDNA